jgi:hypothetical protein
MVRARNLGALAARRRASGATATATAGGTPAKRHKPNKWLEAAVAIVISAAGLMTSWSSYQATLWSGEQTVQYSRAGADRVKSTRVALDASVNRTIEVDLFTAWLNATDAGNARLATIYETRFPPDLRAAFQVWIAQRPFDNPAALPSPFRIPSYRQPEMQEAKALEAKAEAEFAAGQRANRTADAFTRGAVILAMSMFFGGIAQVFRGRAVRVGLAVMALISCAFGVEQIFSLPLLALE